MIKAKLLSICISCFFLSACTSDNSPQTPVLFTGNTMTIGYRIQIGHPLNSLQKGLVEKIISETFAEIDAIYNKWNPHSEISQLNRLQAGEKKPLSLSLFHFFERVDYFVLLSGGKFDPTIEPLQELWKKKLTEGKLPLLAEIDELKSCLGWDKIHFSNQLFYKDDSRTQLDFGGVAKGLCVDLLVENLVHEGFENLYVEWGGEIRTCGKHPAGRPWNICISRLGNRDPNEGIATLPLIDQAIATSGDYFQNWKVMTEEGGIIYCHVFDLEKLQPLKIKPGSVASASIVAEDCLTADALAKVLMLFDSTQEAQEWLEKVKKIHPDINSWIVTREFEYL